jgi:hypothetical protein
MSVKRKTTRKKTIEAETLGVVRVLGLGCFTFSKKVHAVYRNVRHLVHSAFFGVTAVAEWGSHYLICYASIGLMFFTLLGAALKEPSA